MSSSDSEDDLSSLLSKLSQAISEENYDTARDCLRKVQDRIEGRRTVEIKRVAQAVAIRDTGTPSRSQLQVISEFIQQINSVQTIRAQFFTSASISLSDPPNQDVSRLQSQIPTLRSAEETRQTAVNHVASVIDDFDVPPKLTVRVTGVPERVINSDEQLTLQVRLSNVGNTIVTEAEVSVNANDTFSLDTTEFSVGSVDAGGSVTREVTLSPQSGGVFTLTAIASAANAQRASDSANLVVRDRNVITIDGNSDDRLYYQFSVTDSVERSMANGATIDPENLVLGDTVYGFVSSERDSFQYTGELSTFDIYDRDVVVKINGDTVDLGELPGKPPGSDELPNTLTIRGDSESDPLRYQFTVSDALEHAPDSANAEDLIVGQTAYGHVIGGTDRYRYAGELETFDIFPGPVTVSVNGSDIDPGDYRDHPSGTSDLSNWISISGDSSSPLYYQFSVGGNLEHSTDNSGEPNAEDLVVDNLAYGWVTGGVDSYRFSGKITRFQIREGPTEIVVNGTEVDDPEGKP